jgi:hypothetical protein
VASENGQDWENVLCADAGSAPGQISAGVLRLRGLGPRVEPRLLARYWDEGGRDILVRIQGVARRPAQDPHGLYWRTPSERWRSVNKSCT